MNGFPRCPLFIYYCRVVHMALILDLGGKIRLYHALREAFEITFQRLIVIRCTEPPVTFLRATFISIYQVIFNILWNYESGNWVSYPYWQIYYRPQGKVMFSEASVSHFVHREDGQTPLDANPPRGRPPEMQTPQMQTSLEADIPGANPPRQIPL